MEGVAFWWAKLLLHLCYTLDALDKPVDISQDYELPPYQIGELLVSGWHVNTFQVSCEMVWCGHAEMVQSGMFACLFY